MTKPESDDDTWWDVGWQGGLWVFEWSLVLAVVWFTPWQVFVFLGLIVGVLVLFRFQDRT